MIRTTICWQAVIKDTSWSLCNNTIWRLLLARPAAPEFIRDLQTPRCSFTSVQSSSSTPTRLPKHLQNAQVLPAQTIHNRFPCDLHIDDLHLSDLAVPQCHAGRVSQEEPPAHSRASRLSSRDFTTTSRDERQPIRRFRSRYFRASFGQQLQLWNESRRQEKRRGEGQRHEDKQAEVLFVVSAQQIKDHQCPTDRKES